MPSAYILRRNQGYRLEIGGHGRIDFIEFNRIADSAGAAAIYRGSLLTEDPYEDWMMHYRDALEKRFLQVLTDIIINWGDVG